MPQPTDTELSLAIPPAYHGYRLDAALALVLPEAGLRQRRRLFTTHTVRINGIPRSKGYIVRDGDTLCVTSRSAGENSSAPFPAEAGDMAALSHTRLVSIPAVGTEMPTLPANAPIPPRRCDVTGTVHILHSENGFTALYKPGGMHSSCIAGRNVPSVEGMLSLLFPAPLPRLVNRLDFLTSGMLVTALDDTLVKIFRERENAGAVGKLYLAVVRGHLRHPVQLDQALDMAKRRVTRVLNFVADDPLRHTAVLPLRTVQPRLEPQEATYTLVLASIHRGARHQIRAHLAHAGFPIVGDPLYGTTLSEEVSPAPNASFPQDTQRPLYLHHYQISFGTFSATCPPPWAEWSQWCPETEQHLPRS